MAESAETPVRSTADWYVYITEDDGSKTN